jgi:ABC-type nitrate/sulfonate/bicarbonate transport system ATPase subunit
VIEVDGVVKRFASAGKGRAEVLALDHINLDIADNEFLTIIGPSGCGKTTLLRIMAGLATCDSGEIRIDGKAVNGPGPERAMVFQNLALLPWADIQTNVAFGLELRGVSKQERSAKALKLLEVVGLRDFATCLPKELSGGMQQRVGLARALAVEPKVLLMDEPFGSLDEQTRRLLQEELIRIWEHQRKTVVFITHSMEEAVLLGDRVVLMSPRPGVVKEIIDVPIPRPRGPEVERMPIFAELREHLWDTLRGMQSDAPPETK